VVRPGRGCAAILRRQPVRVGEGGPGAATSRCLRSSAAAVAAQVAAVAVFAVVEFSLKRPIGFTARQASLAAQAGKS
jgi:hypothetical protein